MVVFAWHLLLISFASRGFSEPQNDCNPAILSYYVQITLGRQWRVMEANGAGCYFFAYNTNEKIYIYLNYLNNSNYYCWE